jgi:hypothetical protein
MPNQKQGEKPAQNPNHKNIGESPSTQTDKAKNGHVAHTPPPKPTLTPKKQ